MFQSLGAFEEVLRRYPNEVLPRIGYATALEKAGAHGSAVKALEEARFRAGNGETRRRIEGRLKELRERARKAEPEAKRRVEAGGRPPRKGRILGYAGGQMSDMPGGTGLFLSGRLGRFLRQNSDLALDLSLHTLPGGEGAEDATIVNLGFSQRFYRPLPSRKLRMDFVFGYRLNLAAGEGSDTRLYGTLGFETPYRSGSFGTYFDLGIGDPFSVGLNLGWTQYLGGTR